MLNLNKALNNPVTSWLGNNWLPIVAAILAVLYFNQYAATQNLKKINEVELRSAQFEEENKQLKKEVADLEVKITDTETQVTKKESEIIELNQAIAEEKEQREDQKLTTRLIDNDDALLESFKQAYPEFSRANNFGIIHMYDDVNQVTVPYLSLPLYFADAFIVEHDLLESYKITEEKYGEVVTVYEEVNALKDKITLLERQKSEAWSEGYNNGYKLYTESQSELIACYKKPRIKIPSWLVVGATAAGGFAAGVYLNK